jgi:TolB protein
MRRWQHKALIFVVSFAIVGLVFSYKSFAATNDAVLYYHLESDGTMSLNLRNSALGSERLVSGLPYSEIQEFGVGLGPNASFAAFPKSATNTFGNEDIYIVDHASKSQRQLTSLTERELQPRVSPNGLQVSFYYESLNQQQNGIYVINTDGTGLRLVTPANNPSVVPATGADWSPDGTTLSFGGRETINGTQQSGVYTIAANGTGMRRLLAGNVSPSTPEWSPDGRYIFYVKYSSGTQIWVTDLNGTETRITPDDGSTLASEPTVSNSWQLYYTSAQIGANRTYQVRDLWLGDFNGTQNTINIPSGSFSPDALRVGAADPAPNGFPNGSPTAKCPTALFIGVRGSGETESDYNGFGEPIWYTAQQFLKQLPGAEIERVDYPAIAVGYGGIHYDQLYFDSVLKGYVNLSSTVASFKARCPDRPMVLAGYSQGGHVAGNFFQDMTDQSHVAALVMFGDPRFNGSQKGGVNQGTYNSKLNGVFSWSPLKTAQIKKPRQFGGNNPGAKVHSWCLDKDPVCNVTVGNVEFCREHGELCPHIHYVTEGYTTLGGNWAAEKVKAWKP